MYEYRYTHEPEIVWISVGVYTKTKIKNIFEEYERDMFRRKDQSQDERLLIIITMIHHINGLLHGFSDGNLRVNGHILFHKELIRFNFEPIILETYMIFESMTPLEIYKICKVQITRNNLYTLCSTAELKS